MPQARLSANRKVIYPLQHDVTMIYYVKSGDVAGNRSCKHNFLS